MYMIAWLDMYTDVHVHVWADIILHFQIFQIRANTRVAGFSVDILFDAGRNTRWTAYSTTVQRHPRLLKLLQPVLGRRSRSAGERELGVLFEWRPSSSGSVLPSNWAQQQRIQWVLPGVSHRRPERPDVCESKALPLRVRSPRKRSSLLINKTIKSIRNYMYIILLN